MLLELQIEYGILYSGRKNEKHLKKDESKKKHEKPVKSRVNIIRSPQRKKKEKKRVFNSQKKKPVRH